MTKHGDPIDTGYAAEERVEELARAARELLAVLPRESPSRLLTDLRRNLQAALDEYDKEGR